MKFTDLCHIPAPIKLIAMI